MENTATYWKDLYFKVYSENRQLRLELETLQKAYGDLRVKYKTMKVPPLHPADKSNKAIKISHSVDFEHFETMTHTIIAPGYEIQKHLEPNMKKSFLFTPTGSSKKPAVEIEEKCPIEEDLNPDLSLFEELFILSVSSNFKSASVVGRYPNSTDIPAYSVLHDFCFPAGIHVRQLMLTDSASELNHLLYGQNITTRNENMFVFTLKPQEIHSSMQYETLDVLYCCCLVIEDIEPYEGSDWIVPKCFCLISYFPLFELHFQLLSKLLMMIRIRRMEELGGLTCSIGSLKSADITSNEIKVLEEYRNRSEPLPVSDFKLLVPLQDPIQLAFPKDFHIIEIIWLCTPMFSILRFEDFFWLWVSILLEKSIVVVSCNLSLMTSVVLGLRCLIKPLIWPHVFLPIVPDSLRELLEAPVPLLIGMPAPAPALRKSYTNIVWVMLDEPQTKRRLQPGNKILEEVKEMYGDGLKQKLMFAFKDFGHSSVVYQPSERQSNSIKNVIRIMQEYLEGLLQSIPKYTGSGLIDSQHLISCVVPKSHPADHLFLRSLLCTQLLVTYLESHTN